LKYGVVLSEAILYASVIELFFKAFGITPITLKNDTDDKHYKHKFLTIYSKEEFEDDYLSDKKSLLAFKESVELAISKQSNVKEDIL